MPTTQMKETRVTEGTYRTMDEEEVVNEYHRRFDQGISPPLDYGHTALEWGELIELAREALEKGRPTPWADILNPLPPGALS